jgi:hypothetical protein
MAPAHQEVNIAQQAGTAPQRKPSTEQPPWLGTQMRSTAATKVTLAPTSLAWEEEEEPEKEEADTAKALFAADIIRTRDGPGYRNDRPSRVSSFKDEPCHISRVDSWTTSEAPTFIDRGLGWPLSHNLGDTGVRLEEAASASVDESDDLEKRMLTPVDQIKTAEFLGGALIEPEILRSYHPTIPEVLDHNTYDNTPQIQRPPGILIPSSILMAPQNGSGMGCPTPVMAVNTNSVTPGTVPAGWNYSYNTRGQFVNEGAPTAETMSWEAEPEPTFQASASPTQGQYEAEDYYLAPSPSRADFASSAPAKVVTSYGDAAKGIQEAQTLGPRVQQGVKRNIQGPPGQFNIGAARSGQQAATTENGRRLNGGKAFPPGVLEPFSENGQERAPFVPERRAQYGMQATQPGFGPQWEVEEDFVAGAAPPPTMPMQQPKHLARKQTKPRRQLPSGIDPIAEQLLETDGLMRYQKSSDQTPEVSWMDRTDTLETMIEEDDLQA